MASKNTGKPSEKIFDDYWTLKGKAAHVFAFTDASKATGQNRRVVHIDAQPADRLVTENGAIHYAEVKSTATEVDRFEFKLLKKTQRAFAKMIRAAGGPYYVYMHFIQTDEWFRIPYDLIEFYRDCGKSSIPKQELVNKGLQWRMT